MVNFELSQPNEGFCAFIFRSYSKIHAAVFDNKCLLVDCYQLVACINDKNVTLFQLISIYRQEVYLLFINYSQMYQQITQIPSASFSISHNHKNSNIIPTDCSSLTSIKKYRKTSKCEQPSRVNHVWNNFQKATYGKVLLSYLMKGVEVNCHFLQHLADLLDKPTRQIYVFHRKMLSQFGTSLKIVSHLLKCKTTKLMRQAREKQSSLRKNAQKSVIQNDSNQVQELKTNQITYLQNILIAQNSLDQYEDNFDDEIQIFELEDDDECEEKEQNTNDSFDSEDEIRNFNETMFNS